jgi:hypothetical protein
MASETAGTGAPPDVPGAVIRASEIAQFGFCRRAWWLCRVHGYQPTNRAVLDAGAAFHARHGRSVAAAQRWQRLGYVLLGIGVLVGIWVVLQTFGSG